MEKFVRQLLHWREEKKALWKSNLTLSYSSLIADNLVIPLRYVLGRLIVKSSLDLFLAIVLLNIFLPYEFFQKV